MTQNRLNIDTGGLPQASEYLETAWHWLCDARRDAPAQADVWHLRHHRAGMHQPLLSTLLAGEYRLSPVLVVGRGDEQKAMWSAQDALVLKWVALQVAPLLPLHARCEHIKGHEGGPASVRKMSAALVQNGYRRVLRTDVKGYYASIDRAQLLSQVCRYVAHPVLRDLITQYVHYTVEDGGTFHTPEKGISRGCPLSPLMGALYLHEMDEHFGREMQAGRIYYARYMDDIVILTHSRWQLRKHVRALNRFLAEKHLRQHPDKTFIGKAERGFDWMGAWLEPQGVTDIAPRAKANHREKVRRLYERAWRRREPKAVTQRRVSNYRWRWTIWAGSLMMAAQASGAGTVTIVAPTGSAIYAPITSPGAPTSGGVATTRYTRPSGACLDYGIATGGGSGTNADGRFGWLYNNGSGYLAYDPTKGPLLVPSGSLFVTSAPGVDTFKGVNKPGGTTGGQLVAGSIDFMAGTNSQTATWGTWAGTGASLRFGDPNCANGGTWPASAPGETMTIRASGIMHLSVYVPAALPAGTYHVNDLGAGQVTAKTMNGYAGAQTLTYITLYDGSAAPTDITIIRAALGCSLDTTKHVVNLPVDGVDNLSVTVSCSRTSGSFGTSSVSAYLTADDPTGMSDLESTKLSVPGIAGYIAGTWGTTTPACPPSGTSAIQWDGSQGPKAGTLTEASPSLTSSQVVTVKACNFGGVAPGLYTTSAVFSIVTQ